MDTINNHVDTQFSHRDQIILLLLILPFFEYFLKEQSNEIFDLQFFHLSNQPGPQINEV